VLRLLRVNVCLEVRLVYAIAYCLPISPPSFLGQTVEEMSVEWYKWTIEEAGLSRNRNGLSAFVEFNGLVFLTENQ